MLQSRDALDLAGDVYARAFEEMPIMDEVEFQQFAADVQTRAIAKLRSTAVGDDNHLGNLEDELTRKMTPLVSSYFELNRLRSTEQAEQLMSRIWKKSTLASNPTNFQSGSDIKASLEEIMDEYDQQAKGPGKDRVALKHIQSQVASVLDHMNAKLQQQEQVDKTHLTLPLWP